MVSNLPNLRSKFAFASLIGLLFAATSSAEAQTVNRLVTDFGGYWSSTSESTTPRPNGRHNVVAFQTGGVLYSTGVDNSLLTSRSIPFTAADFRTLPLPVMPGNTGTGTNNYIIMGKSVDGNPSSAVVSAVNMFKTRDVLTDGIHGLDIGTGVTNIRDGITINFPVSCINPTAITDDVPDFLFSQIADASTTGFDVVTFRNASGAQIGTSYTLNFNTAHKVGRYDVDLFTLPANTPYETATISGAGSAGDAYRSISLIALKFSDLGITPALASQIASVRITAGGNSDPAFFAYNYASFAINSDYVWVGTTNTDWNTPTNWICGVLPDANSNTLIPVVPTALYPSLSTAQGTTRNISVAGGSSVSVTGTGELRIAGNISNSGTMNVSDGSVSFIGTTGAQTIPNNVFLTNTIKNLTLNNSNGVTLQGALNLTGILKPQAGTFNTGGFLTLKSNAANTAMVDNVTGSVTGSMIIERYIPSRRAFRFLSSPVNGGTINANWQEGSADISGWGTDITGNGGATNGFDVSLSNNPSLFTFNNQNIGTGSSWVAVTNTNVNTLSAGKGYRMLVRGDRSVDQTNNDAPSSVTTLRTTGTIATGNIAVTDINPVAGKYSLIGNPYQAPVNMESVLANSSLMNTTFYYVWDPTINTRGGYVTVNVTNNTNNIQAPEGAFVSVADKYLQPGQACFVVTETSGAPVLNFREIDKHVSTQTTALFRTATEATNAQIRMTLFENNALALNAAAADGFVIAFDPQYSNEINGMDAKKPANQDEHAGILTGSDVFSYQSRELPVNEEVIQLSHTQYRNTNYTYKAQVNGISGVYAYFHDTLNNAYTQMADGAVTSISFEVDAANAASVAANRFRIVFSTEATLGTSNNEFSNTVSVYPNPVVGNSFNVKVPADGNYKVSVVSILGQEVLTQTVSNGGNVLTVNPNQELQSGIYLVKITDGVQSTTKKIVVQ